MGEAVSIGGIPVSRQLKNRPWSRQISLNFAVEFKESNKIMMQNTEKPLLKKQEALSEKKHKKMTKLLDRMNKINRIKKSGSLSDRSARIVMCQRAS